MQSIIALWTPRYYGPFKHQGEQPNPRQESIADVWLKESSATMDSCYYENLLTVPGVSTTGRSSVHAQCLASVFLYWAVHFDRFFFYFWFVCFQVFVLTFSLLQMVHTRNFVTKNTDSGNAIRYLHLSTIHLVWHPPPPPQNKKKMCISSVLHFFSNDWNTQEKRKTKLCIVGGRGEGGGGKEGK